MCSPASLLFSSLSGLATTTVTLDQPFPFLLFFSFHPSLPRFPHGVYNNSCAVSCASSPLLRPPRSYPRSCPRSYPRPRSHLRYLLLSFSSPVPVPILCSSTGPHPRPRSPPVPSLVCVCVVVIAFILDVRLTCGRTSRGHTEFLHLPSAVIALIFIARRIQPCPFPLSTVKSNLCSHEFIALQYLLGMKESMFFMVTNIHTVNISLVDREAEFVFPRINLSSLPVLSTCSLHTNTSSSGCGKERRTLFGPWWPAKAALVRNYLEVYWPCAGGLSAVNAIGTHLRDPINSGLTRWHMAGFK